MTGEGLAHLTGDYLVQSDYLAAEKITATIRRVGKKAAGRLLDGRTWDEYPDVEPD